MAVLKVAITFALIIYLLQRKVGLGSVMLVASLFLGLLFSVPPIDMALVALNAVISKSTVNLMAALILIMFLENVMRKSGMLQQMLNALKALVGDRRIVMAVMPAFIGLLPSAGGARFSCPMVEESAKDSEFTSEDKSYINFWFRHIWEYILPLYPGILLTSELTGLSISRLVMYQLPFSLLALLIGFMFGFGRFKLERPKLAPGEGTAEFKRLVNALSPILVVLVLSLGFKVEISISLAIVLAVVFAIKRYSFAAIAQTLKEGFSLNIVILTLGVMVFKDMLTASGAVNSLPEFFASLGIPKLFLVMALPLVIGLLTGLTQAVVAISFPVLLGLTLTPHLITLAFVAGFAGVMLSPVHLCLVLTVDYFKTTMGRIYRKILTGEGILLGTAVIFALLYN